VKIIGSSVLKKDWPNLFRELAKPMHALLISPHPRPPSLSSCCFVLRICLNHACITSRPQAYAC